MHPQSANLTPKNFPDARCDGSFSANARNGYSPRPMARQKNPCLFLPQQKRGCCRFFICCSRLASNLYFSCAEILQEGSRLKTFQALFLAMTIRSDMAHRLLRDDQIIRGISRR
jgi:hypothetical protein